MNPEFYHPLATRMRSRVVPGITESAGRAIGRLRRLPWVVTGVVALTLALVGGCEAPEKRIAIAEREERMRTMIHDFYEREQLSPENIKELGELGKELERRHQEELARSLQWAEDSIRSDFHDWEEMKPMREEQFKKLFGGEPERIEETWSMMVD